MTAILNLHNDYFAKSLTILRNKEGGRRVHPSRTERDVPAPYDSSDSHEEGGRRVRLCRERNGTSLLLRQGGKPCRLRLVDGHGGYKPPPHHKTGPPTCIGDPAESGEKPNKLRERVGR